jgi:hypothetical protein
MSFARVRVSLLPSLDDPPIDSGELQSAFGKFRQFLSISTVPVSTPMFYAAETDAEGYVGEFIVPLAQALQPPVRMVVSAWVQLRLGRTVQVRIGESYIVAGSIEQAESFLRNAQQLLASISPRENGS